MGDRARRFVQRIGFVDDDLDVAGFEECGEGGEVLAVFTTQVTNCTRVEPRPMSAARAILGRPARRPPVFPTLFGMSNPLGSVLGPFPAPGRRPPQPELEPEAVRNTGHCDPVGGIHAGGPQPDEDVVVAD